MPLVLRPEVAAMRPTEAQARLLTLLDSEATELVLRDHVRDHLAWALLPAWTEFGRYIGSEVRTTKGDADLVVVAQRNLHGEHRNVAYLWEFKSPACCLFQKDKKSKGRARPSDVLYSAENQLFHYHRELQSNSSWRGDQMVGYSDDVYLGGIIIGRDATLHGSAGRPEAAAALECRRKYVFQPNRITLWTWDDFVRLIGRLTHPEPESRISYEPPVSFIR